MKTIELTKEQFDKVIEALDDVQDGSFDLEIEIDETLTVFATGWLETDGYVEDVAISAEQEKQADRHLNTAA